MDTPRLNLPVSKEQISTCIEVLSHFLHQPELRSLASSDDKVKELMRVTNIFGSNSRKDRKRARKLFENSATDNNGSKEHLNQKRSKKTNTKHTWNIKNSTNNEEFTVDGSKQLSRIVFPGLSNAEVIAHDLIPPLPRYFEDSDVVFVVEQSVALKNKCASSHAVVDAEIKALNDSVADVDDGTVLTTNNQQITQSAEPLTLTSEVHSLNHNNSGHRQKSSTTHIYTNSSQCYICHKTYHTKHAHYKHLCVPCGDYNFAKRSLTCDLTGKVAFVTGCRVKIGYEICLSLLRCGATVHGITRFPKDAVLRYSKELDFHVWKSRLFIYGLDLRDLSAVHQFCHYFKTSVVSKLHILINNAAQTVRKPPAFYKHLIETERSILPLETAAIVVSDTQYLSAQTTVSPIQLLSQVISPDAVSPSRITSSKQNQNTPTAAATSTIDQFINTTTDAPLPLSILNNAVAQLSPGTGSNSIAQSALLAMVALIPSDEGDESSAADFPEGVYDEDSQQMDLRKSNSWILKAGEISTVELLECQTINATAPFIFCSEFKPIMTQTIGNKFIINVSAMEGQFYRYKTACHPHTNMAKAALNMFTRTSALQFAEEGSIYMNAVDTGWVTDERPFPLRNATPTASQPNTSQSSSPSGHGNNDPSEMLFQCPLDCLDGAMRVLDPIYMVVLAETEVETTCKRNAAAAAAAAAAVPASTSNTAAEAGDTESTLMEGVESENVAQNDVEAMKTENNNNSGGGDETKESSAASKVAIPCFGLFLKDYFPTRW